MAARPASHGLRQASGSVEIEPRTASSGSRSASTRARSSVYADRCGHLDLHHGETGGTQPGQGIRRLLPGTSQVREIHADPEPVGIHV